MALTAHLDTVIAPRNKDDIAVEPDGRFPGPGVSDNGAGLAALLAVARAWKAVRAVPELRRGLLLAANIGEEGEGNLLGMRRLAKESAAGAPDRSLRGGGRRRHRPHHHPRAGQPPLRGGLHRPGRP